MTLWKRTAGGFALCAGAAAPWFIAELLARSDIPTLEAAGAPIFVVAYFFSFPIFALGLLMIVVGTVTHLRNAWRQRPDA
ncbi:MAG: hypothetical protein NTW20_00335 [Rhodobacterales bacterium]|nr:hypothetical protein [Rhodobacterales bacterium]